MESTTPARKVEQVHAEFLEQRIRGVAANLRDLAETLDRAANSVGKVGEKGWPGKYITIATDVQHKVLWRLANLTLDRLPTDAAAADGARAAVEAPPTGKEG
jgi:hypothetical protein